MAWRVQVLLGVLVSSMAVCGRYTSTSRREVPLNTPQTRDFPCPADVDIAPCVCSSDEYYNLNIDCSLVINEIELARIFQAKFPFTDFLQITIEQDSNDPIHNITILQEKVFGPVSFERVKITNTKMTEVHEQAFTKSHDTLQYLNLANNRLTLFPFDTVQSFSHLDTLLLDGNKFTDLYTIESSSLKTLSVSRNPKLQFEPEVFHMAPGLQDIYMARIGLEELPADLFLTLHNVKAISLEGNLLTVLPENAFNPVNNTITQLFLNNNRITSVVHDSIHGMAPHGFLSMVGNLIEYLPQGVWEPVVQQLVNGTTNFANNPLVCGCDIAWIMLDEVNDYLGSITDTTTCSDGTVLHSLDKQYFVEHCQP